MNRTGDVRAESRGGREDRLLKNAYAHVWTHGDGLQHSSQFFRRVLTSRAAKLSKKSENTAGLQLADVLAHAVRDDILVQYSHLSREGMARFDQQVASAAASKCNRHLYDGRIEGYGRVLFPK